MHYEPYEPKSVRSKRFWEELATFLGVHPAIVRKEFMDHWCVGVDAKSFCKFVMRGVIKPEVFSLIKITEEECQKASKRWEKSSKENDNLDLLCYRAKQIIEVGDETVSNETKTFCFSGNQYLTKGKRYKILSLKEDGGSEFGFTTETDIKGEVNYESCWGVKVLWRDGKEIWNWNLAYLELFMEQHPNHPETAAMKKHCGRQAEHARGGLK